MGSFAALLAVATGAFLLAGVVKGTVGFGFSTVAIGLLGVMMPPAQAATLLLMPALVTNVWQMDASSKLTQAAKRFGWMLVAIFVGTFLGVGKLTGATPHFATAALGAVIALYGAVGLLTVRLTITSAAEQWLSPLVGLTTGVITGATGVFVMPVAPYLNSLGMSRDELVQTLGLAFTASTLALGAGLWSGGAVEMPLIEISLAALPPALAGMLVGRLIRRHLQPSAFHRWFHIGLLILGLAMLARIY